MRVWYVLMVFFFCICKLYCFLYVPMLCVVFFAGPGGYIVEFAPQTSANAMRKRIQTLKHGRWIDEQTRAIIIGLNLYNGNYNYYVAAQMRIEFGTTGAILAKEKLLAFSIDVFDLNGKMVVVLVEWWSGGCIFHSAEIPQKLLLCCCSTCGCGLMLFFVCLVYWMAMFVNRIHASVDW